MSELKIEPARLCTSQRVLEARLLLFKYKVIRE